MRTLTLPLLLAMSGCFQAASMTEVLPDERIQVNLPTDGGTAAKGVGDWSDWYLFTASTTENINAMIGSVLFWVDTITTDYRPTYVDRDTNQAEWGPWATALDPVETLLWVSYDPSSDVHSWGFDQWPRDEERDAATSVIIGEIDPGATREISTGRFDVDYTAINELDPTEAATGLFQVEYDIHADGVSATASFVDFGPDHLDAEYAYDRPSTATASWIWSSTRTSTPRAAPGSRRPGSLVAAGTPTAPGAPTSASPAATWAATSPPSASAGATASRRCTTPRASTAPKRVMPPSAPSTAPSTHPKAEGIPSPTKG